MFFNNTFFFFPTLSFLSFFTHPLFPPALIQRRLRYSFPDTTMDNRDLKKIVLQESREIFDTNGMCLRAQRICNSVSYEQVSLENTSLRRNLANWIRAPR